jgi:hypothetical protein
MTKRRSLEKIVEYRTFIRRMGKAKRAHLARSWVMGTLRFAHPTRGLERETL